MLKAFEITGDEKKKSLLLHFGGEQIFEVFSSFPEEETEDKSFDVILRMFDRYFNPRISDLLISRSQTTRRRTNRQVFCTLEETGCDM